ncbi:unnamed protein product [Didymodactylos carnosus]|uniref:Apple domain-containing protein n=1 Tax=Didymodactylos carnosus TaxID=1234261 RepID=A0A814YF79_9BILA|nr:unnamed protein product [Didymodactylos carnosus]CAF3990953.1 unnamed protein product [Didymodactylos carnosus]
MKNFELKGIKTMYFLFSLILSIVCSTIDANNDQSYPPIRTMTIKIRSHSIYKLGYFANFIENYTSSSIMRCTLICQNNDYCRTATYYPSPLFICSLYEEYSYVGQLLTDSSLYSSSVILFQLCPTGYTEPYYLCFGTSRDPIPYALALNQTQLITTITNLEIFLPRMSTKYLYLPLHKDDNIYLYDLTSSYSFVQELILKPNMRSVI